MTQEVNLTAQQVEAISLTLNSMQRILNRGHEWEYVEVFNAGAEAEAGGHFIGTIIYHTPPGSFAKPTVLLRIEHTPA